MGCLQDKCGETRETRQDVKIFNINELYHDISILIDIWSNNMLIKNIINIISKYVLINNINEYNIINESKMDYHIWGDFYKGNYVYNIKHLIQIKTFDKHLSKKGITRPIDAYNNELNIISKLSHDNILKYMGNYENDLTYNIIIEYNYGPNLFDVLNGEEMIKESLCKVIIKDILIIYKYMDSLRIYNCNLKPESFVFMNKLSNNINDLNLYNNKLMLKNHQNSIIIDDYNKMYELRDTNSYVSPEFAKNIINDKWLFKGIYFKTNDMYTIGMLTYLILYCISPYINLIKYNNDWKRASIANQWKFRDKHVRGYKVILSIQCKHFITKLLHKNIKQRMDINQAINHPWFKHQ